MEQPLPPNGACLLGSFNLTKYVRLSDVWDEQPDLFPSEQDVYFDWPLFYKDIAPIVRMMDNVIDRTIYPLKEQEEEAKSKRRMGIGVTGVANAAEFLGLPYGSPEMLDWLSKIMIALRDEAYLTSIDLAREKGSFPLYSDELLNSEFAKTLPDMVVAGVKMYGLRNSHLLSVAPTGTISLWAGNISSGIEPVFAHEYDRTVIMSDGSRQDFYIQDYAYSEWGIKGKISSEVTAVEHINVLNVASKYVDSACSKTCNVGEDTSFDSFKDLYKLAYDGGSSGCTTFRPAGLRKGVLNIKHEEKGSETEACFIDPLTGERTCSD